MPSVSPAPGQATSLSTNTASSPNGLARDRRYHGADAAFQCHPLQNSGDRPTHRSRTKPTIEAFTQTAHAPRNSSSVTSSSVVGAALTMSVTPTLACRSVGLGAQLGLLSNELLSLHRGLRQGLGKHNGITPGCRTRHAASGPNVSTFRRDLIPDNRNPPRWVRSCISADKSPGGFRFALFRHQ
jgi:hypothetical protein